MVEILKKVLKFIWAFLTVPYHEGRQILVKEVECEDYVQDDSKNDDDSNRAK